MLLDLTSSNPTSASPFYPHSEIRASFSTLHNFGYRPDPFGSEEARTAVQHYYADEGYNLPISRIALTASTSEAYGLLFKLLCDPGDEVLVPVPSYPLFEYLAALESVKPVPYPLRYDGSWHIDFAALRERISSRSRLIVIVNPNNPTGSYLKNREWEMLSGIARENGLPIVSDEVFMSYEFGDGKERVKTLIDKDEVLSFSLNGLSKAAGMPQMKLAWIAINGPEKERKIARERLEVLLDTYLSVNTPVQMALPALFRTGSRIRDQIQSNAKANLEEAQTLLKDSPVHALHTEGGWSLILQLPQTRREEEWIAGLLEEENVVLQPGFFFDMPSEAYAVASLIVDPAVFQEGIGRLQRYVIS
ncbi:MAG: pyridoxal phosphate-dependent aminotransferase [Acidobacteriota bacterium]|nr:pyridoxal phosphate-dependent aminotransferase [Acidobacteriota bacterium]